MDEHPDSAPDADPHPPRLVRDAVLDLARRHCVAYQPTTLDAFAHDAARLANAEVVPDAVEDLLQALLRADVLDDAAMMRLQLDYTSERAAAEADLTRRRGSRRARELRAQLLRAMELADQRLGKDGEVLTYDLDGWVVQEHPDGRIERLAPVGQFRAADFPHPRRS